MNESTGKIVLLVGIVITFLGVIIYFFHDKLKWIGHLPGDIRIERENFRFYFPLTTLVLINILLLLIFYIIRRLNS